MHSYPFGRITEFAWCNGHVTADAHEHMKAQLALDGEDYDDDQCCVDALRSLLRSGTLLQCHACALICTEDEAVGAVVRVGVVAAAK